MGLRSSVPDPAALAGESAACAAAATIDADRDLVRRHLSGDKGASAEIVRVHLAMVYRIGVRMFGKGINPDDYAQEVFLRLFRGLASFRGDSSLRAWISSISMNAARTYRHRLRDWLARFVPLAEESIDEEGHAMDSLASAEPTPQERFLAGELGDELLVALKALPGSYRAAVILRDIEGLSYQEIADALHTDVAAVKRWLHRGRLRMQHMLLQLDADGSTKLLTPSRGRPTRLRPGSSARTAAKILPGVSHKS